MPFVKKKGSWQSDKKKNVSDKIVSWTDIARGLDWEKFYLWLPLNHVPGATNFNYLKIVNEIPVKLLKDAFTLCHLFGCDPEYDNKPRIETLFHMASNFFKISEKDMTVL